MSKEAIDELKRLRSILSGITGLEDDDQEYIEDARKSVDRIIEALAEQPAQQEPVMVDMQPPATQRDRWMYEQGRLAERDSRTHADRAWELAEKVRTALDRQSCPGVYMNLAMEAIVKFYTSPPAQRTWVGLTDEEIDEWTPEIHSVIRAIEAKLEEKNA